MNLLAKSAAARHFGVSAATVSRALRNGLAPALVGERIDVDHPSAVEWSRAARERAELDAERKAAKQAPPAKLEAAPLPTAFDMDGNQPLTSELEGMTLREIAQRFGTLPQYSDHLKAYSVLCDAARKELQVHQAKGLLVARDLVERTTFSHIEALHVSLLRDTATTMALRLAALVRSGASNEEIRAHIQGELGHQLKRTRDAVARSLRPRALRQATKDPEDQAA